MPKEIAMPFTALRRAGADVIDSVRHGGTRVIVTNYGKPVAAIISSDDLAILKSTPFNPEEAVHIDKRNIGSDFEQFLREEGILEEVSAKARKKVSAWVKSRSTRQESN